MSAHLKAGVLKALLTMVALFSPPLLLAEPGIAAFPDGSPISVPCWRCEPGLRAGICQQRYWGCCLRLKFRTEKSKELRILNEATTTGSWELAVPILGIVFCTFEHRGHNLRDGSREVHGHLPKNCSCKSTGKFSRRLWRCVPVRLLGSGSLADTSQGCHAPLPFDY